MAGATGVPFLPGNRIDILNNGDAFYPAMLEAIERARDARSRSKPTSTGPARSASCSREALAAKANAGVTVKILLDAVGSATIGDEILKTLEAGGCQVAWYNPIHWYTFGRFNNRTHRKSLIVDGRSRSRAARGSRIIGCGNARGSRALARHADPDRRAGRDAAADRLRPELAEDDAGS